MDNFDVFSRDIKYRPTPQREAILQVLLQADRHITAEEIYKQVSINLPGINSSTVYRCLKSLRRMGQVAIIDFGENRGFYKHISKSSHHYLVCHSCGKTIDVDRDLFDTVKKQLIEKYRFTAEIIQMVLVGECDHCANKESLDHTGNQAVYQNDSS